MSAPATTEIPSGLPPEPTQLAHLLRGRQWRSKSWLIRAIWGVPDEHQTPADRHALVQLIYRTRQSIRGTRLVIESRRSFGLYRLTEA